MAWEDGTRGMVLGGEAGGGVGAFTDESPRSCRGLSSSAWALLVVVQVPDWRLLPVADG